MDYLLYFILTIICEYSGNKYEFQTLSLSHNIESEASLIMFNVPYAQRIIFIIT